MTLRFRLTLWYTILLALMLLTFALVFHGVLARTLSEQVDDTLRSQAEQIVTIFEKNINPAAAQLPTAIVLSSQVFAQATTSTGELINSSPNLGDMRLPWPDTTKQQNLAGQAALYTWQDSQDTLRILSAPVRSPSGEIAAVVHVAQSLTPIRQMLDTVRLALLIGSGIALVLAAVGGAVISGTALRPLNQIAQTASRIARAEDLNQRIEGAYPNDEVGQLAETFNEMMERLQDLFETQQQLVADVSHELRTPLATIQGNVDLMRRVARRDPSMLVESIDAVDAEVARMSRLVRDLLLLAEADAGLSLNLKPVEVDTVLLEVYRQAQIMAGGKVKVRLGHEDQALVQGDADRLKQLLLNLVSNAIAYTPEGGAVTLSLHRRPDGWVRVSVADTGIGIAAEDLPRIFDRFWRVDRARTRKAGGSGLGLSIARSIAEAHGGTLEVESEVGKGSTFEVLLPQLNGSGPKAS
jgi:heavy metal sensor kinase